MSIMAAVRRTSDSTIAFGLDTLGPSIICNSGSSRRSMGRACCNATRIASAYREQRDSDGRICCDSVGGGADSIGCCESLDRVRSMGKNISSDSGYFAMDSFDIAGSIDSQSNSTRYIGR